MSYAQDTLSPNENILYTAKFDIWSTLFAWLVLFVLGIVGYGIYYFIYYYIKKLTTEMIVTNLRFVYKTGWIKRDTQEIKLTKIEEINLEQGFWGRLLDFGKLKISGTGIGFIQLPRIDAPLQLRTAIGNARTKENE
jgi:uncharacterized membrane protein YdbT with pleckstrin-like domain